MPSYKLKYFNAKGFGEVSRLLFALAGQEYEDVRFTQETWPAEKPNTPFGQMPLLVIDGKQYGQSSAIARYLARTFGFYGANDLEALEVDQVLGIVQDVYLVMINLFYEKDEARKAELAKQAKEEKLPNFLGMFEKIASGNENGVYVGKKFSLADVVMFDLCEKLTKMEVSLEKFPSVRAARDKLGAEPKIQEWLKKRPETEN